MEFFGGFFCFIIPQVGQSGIEIAVTETEKHLYRLKMMRFCTHNSTVVS